mmetsp:Transcript_52797/g.92680  ORF Transcript_52797/g.92680 Transcript_52797/m.92680 type:complete len:324 (+) Transcript_52797:634-1605(+)
MQDNAGDCWCREPVEADCKMRALRVGGRHLRQAPMEFRSAMSSMLCDGAVLLVAAGLSSMSLPCQLAIMFSCSHRARELRNAAAQMGQAAFEDPDSLSRRSSKVSGGFTVEGVRRVGDDRWPAEPDSGKQPALPSAGLLSPARPFAPSSFPTVSVSSLAASISLQASWKVFDEVRYLEVTRFRICLHRLPGLLWSSPFLAVEPRPRLLRIAALCTGRHRAAPWLRLPSRLLPVLRRLHFALPSDAGERSSSLAENLVLCLESSFAAGLLAGGLAEDVLCPSSSQSLSESGPSSPSLLAKSKTVEPRASRSARTPLAVTLRRSL